MTNNEQITELLNDLVKINNDRIEGYEKAADQTKASDIDLQAIFCREIQLFFCSIQIKE